MFKGTTWLIFALLGIYIAHGPTGNALPVMTGWGDASQSAALEDRFQPVASSFGLLAMGPDPGGKNSGTQWVPDQREIISAESPIAAKPTAQTSAAELRAQLLECDAVPGDARNHCIEYVKLRASRS